MEANTRGNNKKCVSPILHMIELNSVSREWSLFIFSLIHYAQDGEIEYPQGQGSMIKYAPRPNCMS